MKPPSAELVAQSPVSFAVGVVEHQAGERLGVDPGCDTRVGPVHSRTWPSAFRRSWRAETSIRWTGDARSIAWQAAVAADWPSTMNTGSIRIEP